MYFSSKIRKESKKYWKEHFNSPDTPWTAEFNIGWAMEHRPLWFIMSYIEVAVSIFLTAAIIFLFSKNIGLSIVCGAFIPLAIGIIIIFRSDE